MERMKTFLKYGLWIILFFVFSEFCITVSLNSSYKNIKRRDTINEVQIKEAKATLVNGKIEGTIKNSNEDYLTGKYVEIDLYSKRDILVGKKYIPITTTETTTTQDFKINFELKDVESYTIAIVDKKQGEEIKLLPKELSKSEIVVATAIALLIFW